MKKEPKTPKKPQTEKQKLLNQLATQIREQNPTLTWQQAVKQAAQQINKLEEIASKPMADTVHMEKVKALAKTLFENAFVPISIEEAEKAAEAQIIYAAENPDKTPYHTWQDGKYIRTEWK